MDISVIIVTMNQKQFLKDCLQSIHEKTKGVDYEVIVSDNGSVDGSNEMVKKDFPWVTLIENKKNLGFGTANNVGAKKASGDVLFFLNDDTQLTENSLKKVYTKVMNEPSIGCLGFHLLFPDGSHQESVRRYPQLSDQAILLTKMHNFFPNLGPIQRYLAQDFDYTKEQDVDQVMGACMIMRKEVFERANGFDEAFFVWFEEVDLQKRIHENQGLRIVYSPFTEMIHVKGATFGKFLSYRAQRLFNDSMRKYFFKHHGIVKTILLILLQPLSIILALLVQTIKKLGVNTRKFKHGQN